jgi:hypothetical protein
MFASKNKVPLQSQVNSKPLTQVRLVEIPNQIDEMSPTLVDVPQANINLNRTKLSNHQAKTTRSKAALNKPMPTFFE